MEFKTPLVLVLVIFVPLVLWFLHRRRSGHAFGFSSAQILEAVGGSWKTRFGFIPFALRLLAIALLCFALAGPRKALDESKATTEGIDIVLSIDCSGSMAAEDFQLNGQRQNRLDVIKKVVAEFIDSRKDDRLGLVAFGGRAYTVCPLTTDRNWLQANLERIKIGLVEEGTAIGSGIASSLSRFKDSEAKSKIIVLLTDGSNNAGKIDPLSASKTAAAMGIKIYTIGAGTKGYAPFPVQDMFGRKFYQNVQVDIDEDTLQKIAETTKAKYYRATDTESLRQVYKDIDRLEKTKIEHSGYREYQELFGYFVTLALIFLGLELILINSLFLKIP
jgi:Ca-activated chloride channel homolog